MSGAAIWTRRNVIATGLVALGAGSGWSGPAAAQGGGLQTAPMRLTDGGALLVRARIAGESCLAMIDNGVPWSILDLGFARERGWNSHNDRTPTGAPTRTKGQLDVEVAGVRERVRPRLIDLSLFGRIDGEPLRALIGPDLLEKGRWVFDFDAGTFALVREGDAFAPPANATTFDVRARHPVLLGLPLSIEGAAPVPAAIDLGNAATLTVSEGELAQSWFRSGRAWSSSASVHQGMSSSAQAKNILATLESVRIGPHELRDVPVEIVAPDPDDQSAAQQVRVGPELLSRFFAVMDQAGGKVSLAPRDLGRAFRRNLTGLGTREGGAHADDGALRVMHVGDNSPAAGAGLKVDDVVITIDGAPPKRETLRAAEEGQVFRIGLASGMTHEVTARRHY